MIVVLSSNQLEADSSYKDYWSQIELSLKAIQRDNKNLRYRVLCL